MTEQICDYAKITTLHISDGQMGDLPLNKAAL